MHTLRRIGLLAAPALLLLAHAAPAQTFYADRTAFAAAAAGLTTETFDGLVGTPAFPQNYGAGVSYETFAASGITLDGVNFVGFTLPGNTFGDETYILGAISPPNSPADAYEINGTDALVGGRQTLTATFAAGTTAFGTDIGEANVSGPPITIDANVLLDNGQTYSQTLNFVPGSSQFIGFTDGTDITGVTFFDPADSAQDPIGTPYAIYDNFSFGSAAAPAVPEPGSLSLLGLGLGGVLLATRRRRRA